MRITFSFKGLTFLRISGILYVLKVRDATEETKKIMKDNNKMNKEQFKNQVLALVSEDALPMVDALTEQGFAEGWTPAEVAGQCEADA